MNVLFNPSSPSRSISIRILFFGLILRFILGEDIHVPVLPDATVLPSYNWTYLTTSLHAFPLFNNIPTMKELEVRRAVRHGRDCCLTKANYPVHIRNTLKTGYNVTDLRTNPPEYYYLYNTTFWINEYLHMGHVHYIIVIMQILQMVKIDRIVMQRAICFGTLCWGMGTMESWYKGFFAAILEASGQPLVPVFLRWIGKDKYVRPVYFSIYTPDNYVSLDNITAMANATKLPLETKPYVLQPFMCFEELYMHDNLRLGAIPAVSTASIRKFKETAYKMVDPANPLKTHFAAGKPPFTILFGYRGSKQTRSMDNVQEFIHALHKRFPPPDYVIKAIDPSNPPLGFKDQIRAVAEAHVVIANHGAFEMNMIYMRNSSLLIEIFGDYAVAEMHTFHRTAVMFGVFYGRYHTKGLKDHDQKNYSIAETEIKDVCDIVSNYFDLKPFLSNLG